MSRAATFRAEEKILPTLGRLEPGVKPGEAVATWPGLCGHPLRVDAQSGCWVCVPGAGFRGWGQAGCYELLVLIFPLVTSQAC